MKVAALAGILSTLLTPLTLTAVSTPPSPQRTPVLLELFTSESCSSCPPADRLLASLDQEQPIPKVELIVLSEHVDYWDDTGWRDPYSSNLFTARQQAYAKRFRLDNVYTPELVVDGQREGIGSNAVQVRANVEQSAALRKAPIALNSVEKLPGKIHVQIATGKLNPAAGDATLFAALTLEKTTSKVKGGENTGRMLAHVAVVKALVRIAPVSAGSAFSRDVDIPLPPGIGAEPNGIRLVAFLQADKTLRILGATQRKL